jgi:cation diffusion facilitator CzcD-associated flavoprotein CzcO
MNRTEHTLIIGAGPGGLCAAAALKARGLAYEIVDAGRQIGGIWDVDRAETPMYDTAHFISSKTLSGFSDFPMPEEYPDYPAHNQILAYVQAFARHHGLEDSVALNRRVASARPEADSSCWRVTFDDGEERVYGGLCIATGSTWVPRVPTLAGEFQGAMYHSFHYRSPEEFEGKRVLILGGGNSGCDIACDAALTASRAFISLRRGYHFVPKYVLGKPADVFAHAGPRLPAWLEQRFFGFLIGKVLVGDLERFGLKKPDHPILASHPIMNTQILHHLGHGDLEAVPDVQELRAHSVLFTDGREEEVDLILLATGYEHSYPVLGSTDEHGPFGPESLYLNLAHREHPTLFFMGQFETDGAAYSLYGLQAGLLASYLKARAAAAPSAQRFDALRSSHRPDLRGGRTYVASPRHDRYVKGDVYERALKRTARRLGWD